MKCFIVKITFIDGRTDIKECLSLEDLSLVGVFNMCVIREETL